MRAILVVATCLIAMPGRATQAQRAEPAGVQRPVAKHAAAFGTADPGRRLSPPVFIDSVKARRWTKRGVWTWVGIGAVAGSLVAGGAMALDLRHESEVFFPGLLIGGAATAGAIGGGGLGLIAYQSTRTQASETSPP